MRTHILAVLIVLSVIGSSLVFAIEAQAGGSERGEFPNRTFTISKGVLGKTDRATYTATILPSADCTWWVELEILGGSAVKVDVYQWSNQSSVSLSHTKVSDVGGESEHVSLKSSYEYRATFSYVGKPGDSVLKERMVCGPFETTPHEPILIISDANFTAENGVVGGSGTARDPYIIEGWEITATAVNCIEIRDTRAHFEIRHVNLISGSSGAYALYLYNAYDGDVTDSFTLSKMGGILMDYCSNVKVMGCALVGDIMGAQISSSTNFVLRDCTFSEFGEGLHITTSHDFDVVNCSVTALYYLCWIGDSSQGRLVGNYMEALGERAMGVYLMSSTSMTLYANQLVNTSIDIVGWYLPNFNTHTIPKNNTVNGRPILYYLGSDGLMLDGANAGQVIMVQCQNVIVSNMTFSRDFAAVILAYSDHAVVRDNLFSSCGIGLRVDGCTDVQVSDNRVDRAVEQGIGIWDTVGAVVENNTLSSAGIWGYQTLMPIFHSSDLLVTKNTLVESWTGIEMFSTSSSGISGNNVSHMDSDGISIGYSDNIAVSGNALIDNEYGLVLDNCSSTTVYHNAFVNNSYQAFDYAVIGNQWDFGYPNGGNFWSDYRGMDADNDGIGDTPYAVPPGSRDRYPLMTPWGAGSSEPSYTAHAPIIINGDAGFTRANGVVSGNGSRSSPYVLEKWAINLASGNGIDIRDTNAYFIIRNVHIYNVGSEYSWGISFTDVSNGSILGCTISGNYVGLYLWTSSNLRISGNTLFNNSHSGIALFGCFDSVVERNTIWSDVESWRGISLSLGTYNVTVATNIVSGIHNNLNLGFGIEAFRSDNSKFVGNSVSGCDAGIYLNIANGCLVYHNNLMDNSKQAYDDGYGNRWYLGYPTGGNYWSDYTGMDANEDGIGDTPYTIPPGSQDIYPLISPYSA